MLPNPSTTSRTVTTTVPPPKHEGPLHSIKSTFDNEPQTLRLRSLTSPSSLLQPCFFNAPLWPWLEELPPHPSCDAPSRPLSSAVSCFACLLSASAGWMRPDQLAPPSYQPWCLACRVPYRTHSSPRDIVSGASTLTLTPILQRKPPRPPPSLSSPSKNSLVCSPHLCLDMPARWLWRRLRLEPPLARKLLWGEERSNKKPAKHTR